MGAVPHIALGLDPMQRLWALAGLSLLAVAGCAAQPGQGGVSAAPASSAPHELLLGGRSLQASLQPGAAGRSLGANGVRRLSGQTVRVIATDGALANDQGALAKKAARAGCQQAGGRFNEAAIGRFERQGDAWLFDGGCA